MAVLYIRNSSGEFEGVQSLNGKTAYQAAKEGGYTGTESEFNSKLAQEIPTALPNPQPITINGQRYDGSEAVTVTVSSEGGGTPVEIDDTLTQSGKAADAKVVGDKLSELNQAIDAKGNPTDEQVATAVNAYLTENPVSGGMSSAEKEALLLLLKHGEFTADISPTVRRLADLFAGKTGTLYSVTNTLAEGATNSNAATEVYEGTTYSAVLTMADGMDIETISVTMGGVDVTNDVYNKGNIYILSVSGDLVITVAVKASTLLYQLPQETVFDGATEIDTGVAVMSRTSYEPFSIVADFSTSKSSDMFWVGKTGTGADQYAALRVKIGGLGLRIGWGNGWETILHPNGSGSGTANGLRFVITHDPSVSASNVKLHTLVNGALTTKDIDPIRNLDVLYTVTQTLLLGHDLFAGTYFTGTIHDFAIYGEALTDEAIAKYLAG